MKFIFKTLNRMPCPSILLKTIMLLVFPEVWLQSVDLSGWQVPKDSVQTDPETKPQTTMHSSVLLPGSVIDSSEDIQEYPSCVIESVVVEDTPEESK